MRATDVLPHPAFLAITASFLAVIRMAKEEDFSNS